MNPKKAFILAVFSMTSLVTSIQSTKTLLETEIKTKEFRKSYLLIRDCSHEDIHWTNKLKEEFRTDNSSVSEYLYNKPE